jgi:hypothetical protein
MTTTNDPQTPSWVGPTTKAITWHCEHCPDRHIMSTLDIIDVRASLMVQRHGERVDVHLPTPPHGGESDVITLTGREAAQLRELLSAKPRRTADLAEALLYLGAFAVLEGGPE